MGQILTLLSCFTLINSAYFIAGVLDSRISALAQKRQDTDGFWINVGRITFLISLQILFYWVVGLHTYSALTRLLIHGLSILFLHLSTKMSVIGLTGGIACGKSTVVDILKEKTRDAFKIIDCDKILHDMYKDPAFIDKVFKTFGKESIVAADGKSVDRSKLGAIIFADKTKRD